MVSLQHFVQIIMVAQLSSYWYRMNACVQATSVHTTAILYHFHRTWWIICTLKISYVTVFTHILIQRNYHCTTVLAVTGVHCKHCAIMVTGVYCKSCAMMVTAVQCWPFILSHDGHLGLCKPCALCHDGRCCTVPTPYLAPCWSLVSTANLYPVTWQSPVYALQRLDVQIFISLPHAKWWHTIEGHMHTSL